MPNNNLYKILEEKFVKPFRENATIFSGFTYQNDKDGRTVYPRLMRVPEKGNKWCFYDKRSNKEHISIDDFIKRYSSRSIVGVGGYFEDGKSTSITFSRKELLNLSKEFSEFLKVIPADSGNSNLNLGTPDSVINSSTAQTSNQDEMLLNGIGKVEENKGNNIPQLKADMEDALSDLDQRKFGEDVDAVVKRRVGQSTFRLLLEAMYGSYCHVSKIVNRRLLIASHIVPWSKSTREEKTDPDNGLLLAVNWDVVFDKGFICFDEDGRVVFSDELNQETTDKLGLDRNVVLDDNIFTPGRKIYLQRHREQIFERWKKEI